MHALDLLRLKRLRHPSLSIATFILVGLQCPTIAFANSDDVDQEYAAEPQKVYVESADGTYLSTRSDEHCFYHEEHDHIHCYAQDPNTHSNENVFHGAISTSRYPVDATDSHRNVIVEDSHIYRQTRVSLRSENRSHPIATGIGVGLAIGLPILIHNELRDHRKHHRYSHRYARDRWDNYGYSYRKKHHYGYRDKSYRDWDRYRSKHRRKARAYFN